MSETKNAAENETGVQPSLAKLMSRYLQQQADAQSLGLATSEPASEVVLYDAGPVQPIDAKVAWSEAVAAAGLFTKSLDTRSWNVPPQWPQLVSAHEPAAAIAMCVGNFPQLLRNLQLLLHKTDLSKLRPSTSQPIAVAALVDWTDQVSQNKQYPQLLAAIGALRLARQFAKAEALMKKHEHDVPAELQSAWANEQAALAWHSGRIEEARRLWRDQVASVPVLFNRGMAALFCGEPAEAHSALTQAITQLPETSAWHHLGRLYLTLAQSR